MTGGVESEIVTVKLHEDERSALSTAVQVTRVTPSKNRAGVCAEAAGVQETDLIPLPSVAKALGA